MPVHLVESREGSPVVDMQIKLLVKGHEISGCIMNGGSRINVISETTCHSLGITQ
mgnify:CR=1 FL=1